MNVRNGVCDSIDFSGISNRFYKRKLEGNSKSRGVPKSKLNVFNIALF